MEFSGHGGAQKGEQKGVQHGHQEDESASRNNDFPQAQDFRRRASVAPGVRQGEGQVQDRAQRQGQAGQERSQAARCARRASAAAKRRATKTAAPAENAKRTAAKAGKAIDTKAAVAEVAAAQHASDVKAAHSPQRPAAAAAAKPSAAAVKPFSASAKSAPPLAKRAPVVEAEAIAVKPTKPIATPRPNFRVNEFVVYPSHGVGQIVAVEDQEVAGFRLELFVINFAKDKMTLRVPTSKVVGVGMRKLSEPDVARRSLEILTGRARIKRTMWSRRAQEYEAKINSGDINAIAEVVRDLYRSEAQPEQSYSERQLYEAALDRIMREIAAVQKLSEIDALKLIEGHLKKSQRRAAKAEAGEGDEAAVEEAA